MALHSSMPDFGTPQHQAQQESYHDDDENTMLEESSIGNNTAESGLQPSPPMAFSRRHSFAVDHPVFPHKSEEWQSLDVQSVPSMPFGGGGGTGHDSFMAVNTAHSNVFHSQGGQWDMSDRPSSHTLHHFNQAQPPFDMSNPVFQSIPQPGQNQNQSPFANTGNPFNALSPGEQSMPPSPPKDWALTGRDMQKQMQLRSPPIRSHNELRRGDGIRKKNARFDIPEGHNLLNIDSLIEHASNQDEVKELKTQKRLLRNRQAALDSRQRKKQHTERLEEEKKHLSNVISSLQEQIAMLTREKDCLRDRWTAEKDEMIRTHTLETGELRKKIDVLTTEQLQRLESPRVSARTNVPEADFANPYGGLYPTGRPPGGWANSDSMHDVFPSEQQQRQQEAHAPAKKLESPQAPETEKGASQGGLLFMLLLVGAFVMSSRSMPALSSVSDDVRVASASILDHVLRDAELDGAHTNKQAGAPQPSVAGWVPPAVTIAGTTDTNMDEDAPSMLEQLGDSLIQPSREQTNEQIFSLSAAQYDGVSSHDYLQNTPERCVSQERKSISQALAAARAVTKEDSSADVYTRTLHPKHVIDKFARIVARLNSVHTSSNATKHDDNDDSTTMQQ